MNHQHAIEAQFPERYVFGDLSETERDTFEEHLADCSQCFEEVRATESFAANTRSVFQEKAAFEAIPTVPKPANRWRWLTPRALAVSGGLNLAFALAAVYAFVAVVPPLRHEVKKLQTPSIAEVFTVQGITRSATSVYMVMPGVTPHFRMDLPKRFDRYLCEIESLSGRTLRKQYDLQIPSSTETLDLTVPVAGLAPGDYDVRLTGANSSGSELLASFTVRLAGGR